MHCQTASPSSPKALTDIFSIDFVNNERKRALDREPNSRLVSTLFPSMRMDLIPESLLASCSAALSLIEKDLQILSDFCQVFVAGKPFEITSDIGFGKVRSDVGSLNECNILSKSLYTKNDDVCNGKPGNVDNGKKRSHENARDLYLQKKRQVAAGYFKWQEVILISDDESD